MKLFQRLVLVIAVLTFGYLLWRMDPADVFRRISQVGWGIVLILGQEIVAHWFNAWGWRFCFAPEDAGAYPLFELTRLRIAGDGVNYLTPSATIAGEFIRAILLNESRSTEVRYAAVTVAKMSQAVAQILFIFGGVLAVLLGAAPALMVFKRGLLVIAGGIMVVLIGFTAFCFWLWPRLQRREPPTGRLAMLGTMPLHALRFISRHPARFTLSLVGFAAGYAWGAFEGYWICYFLGVPVSVAIALVIEVFSNLMDSLLFMVPAKIGTQEAGKTAIFAALRMKPSAGFAFGLVRHLREFLWGGVGLLIYSTYKKRSGPPADKLDPVSERVPDPLA